MALPHAAPGTPIDVTPLGEALNGARSIALFKSRDLETLRLVLRRGDRLPAHRVPGDVVVHCLEGSLRLEAGDGATTLQAGQLLWLDGGVPHAVEALADASALLTLALVREPGPGPDGGPKPLTGGPVGRD